MVSPPSTTRSTAVSAVSTAARAATYVPATIGVDESSPQKPGPPGDAVGLPDEPLPSGPNPSDSPPTA